MEDSAEDPHDSGSNAGEEEEASEGLEGDKINGATVRNLVLDLGQQTLNEILMVRHKQVRKL